MLDEPTDLPEGEEVELLLADEVLMDEDSLNAEERAALDAELEAGERDIAEGRLVSVEEFWSMFRAER